MASITKKPTMKVTGLSAPTRGSGDNLDRLTVKWNVPSDATKSSNQARIEGFDVHWDIECVNIDNGGKKTIEYQKRTGNTSQREWTLYLNDFTDKNGRHYNRSTDFYPVSGYWCMRDITVKVRGYNSKGVAPWVTVTGGFLKPNQPKITKIEQNSSNGRVSVTVEHDKGSNFHDIWNTRVISKVWSSSQNGYLANTGNDSTLSRSSSSGTFYIEDIYNRMSQSYDDWIRVDVKAFARGLWGRSDEMDDSKTVKKSLYISWPQKPAITGVSVDTSSGVTGKITVKIETGYHPATEKQTGEVNPHPTTGVKLEKLVNVEYETIADIPGDANWTECGAEDNGVCTALSSTVAELQPAVGKYTWVRVKSWNQVEGIFYRYSEPYRMSKLERVAPTAADDSAIIYSAVSGDDGKSAVIGVAWPADDSTGTEIAWSTSPNAWRSNDEPNTYRVKDLDDGPVTVGSTTYAHSAIVHASGLTEGTEYHFRCRRYLVADDDSESFGPWYPEDTTIKVTPTTAPKSVTLVAPGYVRRGSPIQLAWTFDSESEQKEWQVITGDTYTTTETVRRGSSTATMTRMWVRENQYTSGQQVVNPTVQILASGTDAMGGCVLVWDEHLEDIIGSDNEIPIAVRVSTGGTFVTSEAKVVTIADQPTLALAASTLTAQPLSLTLTCDVPAEVVVVVSSEGVAGGYAEGGLTQTRGDTVWSTAITPEWTYVSNTGKYSATLTAPSGLELLDGGTYLVEAHAVNAATGLTSDDVSVAFLVNYSRKAPEPSGSISVTPYDVVDEGVRSRYAVISLAAPTEGISSDVYDVYRLTPDGPQLIADGVGTAETVTDPWAPYGKYAELSYRVACRTVNGCTEFADYPYALDGRELRIDFGDSYVELPYDLKVSDGYSKDFEARQHLDGSVDGYWNRGVSRVAGLTTNAIRVVDEQNVRAVRRLARHTGPCFVRLPDGSAYQADVQVGGIERQANNSAVAITLNATEVGLTSEFMATLPPDTN